MHISGWVFRLHKGSYNIVPFGFHRDNSYRTEQSYCKWILRYVRYYDGKHHPKDMGKVEIERFLSHLATDLNVAPSTQNQAFNALLFLYEKVLHIPFAKNISATRSKRSPKIPTVLTQAEVKRLFSHLKGNNRLMAGLLYGCGLRLMECLRLRIMDIDFGQQTLRVHDGKGGKDRVVPLPLKIKKELQSHIDGVIALHATDLEEGYGEVYLPDALARKYKNAPKETAWQYVFPAKKRSNDPRTGAIRRHHVLPSGLQKAVKRAVDKARIYKKAGCHTLRHSFAVHLLENGVSIRIVQELMGHADVKTTEIYTHVMNSDINAVQSPLDLLHADKKKSAA